MTSAMASTAAHGPPWPTGVRSGAMRPLNTSWLTKVMLSFPHFVLGGGGGGVLGVPNHDPSKIREMGGTLV